MLRLSCGTDEAGPYGAALVRSNDQIGFAIPFVSWQWKKGAEIFPAPFFSTRVSGLKTLPIP
jgi:hypothetical protein